MAEPPIWWTLLDDVDAILTEETSVLDVRLDDRRAELIMQLAERRAALRADGVGGADAMVITRAE